MKAATALGVLLFFLFSTIAYSQDTLLELNPVTVISNLSPTTVSKTGRNIIVFRGDQFNNLPVNSVDELLRYVPGIEVQARGPMGTQSDIIIRGGTFQQVLVILDGLRLNDPITGHFNSYIPVSPAEIERIEVLKGASSAIYGSEAVGGVVQIITKTFAAKQTEQKSLSAQLSGGNYNLISGGAGGFYSNGKTAVGGGWLSNNANGQPLRGTEGYFHNNTASVSLSHYFSSALQLSLRTAYDNRDFSAQNFYTSFASDTATERVRSLWNQLSLSYQKGKNRFSLNTSYKAANDLYAYSPASVANQNESGLWQVLLRNDHRFTTDLSLNTGLQYINRRIRSNDRGNHTENQAAGFAVLNYNFLSGLVLSPAARLDWNEQRGFEFVPQLALAYSTHRLQLRGNIGKTIRDADFTERYNNYQKANVASGRIGNPDLYAETSLNYEAGIDIFSGKVLKLSGTFFQRFHQDLIDYVTTDYNDIPHNSNLVPGGNYLFAQNIADVNITGAEADIQYTKALSDKRQLWGNIGATYTNAKSRDNAAVNAIYLSSFARWITNCNIVYTTSRFTFSVNGLYKNRPTQSASAIKANLSGNYFVMNGKVGLNIIKSRVGVFVQVDNVFNENYSDLLGAQMPGRWWQAGASLKL